MFLLLSTVAHAGDGLPRYLTAPEVDLSPSRELRVEHYRGDEPGISPVPHQIWLASTKDPSKRHLLYTHERMAEVLFSDEEKWLVINDHDLSNESRLLLFRRKAELEYEQVADLTDAAWSFFCKEQGVDSTGFDHSYVSALRWAGDAPPTLLLCLQGHADGRNYTDEWYCLYDVEKKTFSLNFAEHNKHRTKLQFAK